MNWIIPQKFLAFSSPESHVDRGMSHIHDLLVTHLFYKHFKKLI